ncbi:MAG: DUF4153 domain-containing protein [Bacteroidetes bacterium GWE2_41_25]|nr:MAG: DUF4153 domain-containing protein [Bacteroidetes bacterium GWA2_40_15]OFX87965.1 MAG: DUF4153 domain-containing protein [Bacteroidetes bacterium GWC2_40_22]OFY03229.1 MAG: DUF4153 domain-containing protein [Bacteroidetes bacterium GWE2_41_25]HBH84473.1 DUF4153 domain-containing protein [Bacteroidales bacterium]HBQ84530.1 DUF4153 domain-containing protein [Bacteroidales bacterium]
MKNKIKEHINDPEKLEQLFNDDKNAFESGFEEVYSEIEKSELSEYWKIRLDYRKKPGTITKTNLPDIFILITSCLVTGVLIKIPFIFNIPTPEVFYTKNAGIIVFSGLILYITWTNKVFELKRLIYILAAFLILTIYVNLLPSVTDSDSIYLVYIHLPLLMWCLYGLVFIDFNLKDKIKRIEFIRYNGDLAILMALIAITGGILTGITIGLFEAIGISIENFYMENVVIVGAVSVPIVATYIIKNYTTLTNKLAPIIANIFSPLVLLTAVIFLIALAISEKDLYSDREFLLIFNIMLLGVMAVIVFSISETSTVRKQKFNELILFILSIITVIIDLIALSAIFYRLGTFGLTPNRLAVLGSNILILGNLVLLIIDLYKVNFKISRIREVELTIAKYLPLYLIWILFVVFGFPLFFGMK